MKIKLITLFFLACSFTSAHAQSACDVGNDSAFSNSLPLPANTAFAIKFTVVNPGTLTGISVIPGIPPSANTNVKMAVYTDNAGAPGNLLAFTTAIPYTGAVVTATVTPVSITPGDYHVVGIIDANAPIAYDAASPQSLYGLSMTFSSPFPASGSGFTVVSGYAVNIWMNITCVSSAIEEMPDIFSVHGYPDPAKDIYTLVIKSASSTNLDIEMLDIRGKQLFVTNATIAEGENILDLPIYTLSNGIYFMRIIDGEKILYQGKVFKD